MKLKIVNKSTNALPEYKTPDSSGMDLRAYLPEGSITLAPMERKNHSYWFVHGNRIGVRGSGETSKRLRC